ncbi:MAG: hypothetical protein SOW46_13630 [Candidatus Aphodomonas sp.]|nr:hypothetical protein [Candidatus Aphodomonas sp.]
MPAQTTIATEIARIQTNRNAIRTKLVNLGLAATTATLDACATAIEGIENRGAVNASVTEGNTYTIPKGYHNGSGTVSGIAGGGNYTLQSKSITPTKKEQNVTSDDGYYGLSSVTVAAIPEAYQDVSSTTAAAGNVLAGKVFVTKEGAVTTGTMANNGTVSKTLTPSDASYTVPAGYHSGTGKVSISVETKSVTPAETAQDVTPTTGKVLSKVTVAAIPAKYADATDVSVTADKLLKDETAIGWDAAAKAPVAVTGTMPNNGTASKTLDTATTSYTIAKGYHSGSGKVSISVETKSVTPAETAQDVTPTTGKVLSKVTVARIPTKYADATGMTAAAAGMLADTTAIGWDSAKSVPVKLTGTMANNGSTSASIDGLTQTSVTVPAGYTSGGTISLTDDIYEALAAI